MTGYEELAGNFGVGLSAGDHVRHLLLHRSEGFPTTGRSSWYCPVAASDVELPQAGIQPKGVPCCADLTIYVDGISRQESRFARVCLLGEEHRSVLERLSVEEWVSDCLQL